MLSSARGSRSSILGFKQRSVEERQRRDLRVVFELIGESPGWCNGRVASRRPIQRQNRHVPGRAGPPKHEGAAESSGFLRAAGSNCCLGHRRFGWLGDNPHNSIRRRTRLALTSGADTARASLRILSPTTPVAQGLWVSRRLSNDAFFSVFPTRGRSDRAIIRLLPERNEIKPPPPFLRRIRRCENQPVPKHRGIGT